MIEPQGPQGPQRLLEAALDEAWLDLDDLCRLTRLSPEWVHERVTKDARRHVG